MSVIVGSPFPSEEGGDCLLFCFITVCADGLIIRTADFRRAFRAEGVEGSQIVLEGMERAQHIERAGTRLTVGANESAAVVGEYAVLDILQCAKALEEEAIAHHLVESRNGVLTDEVESLVYRSFHAWPPFFSD